MVKSMPNCSDISITSASDPIAVITGLDTRTSFDKSMIKTTDKSYLTFQIALFLNDKAFDVDFPLLLVILCKVNIERSNAISHSLYYLIHVKDKTIYLLE